MSHSTARSPRLLRRINSGLLLRFALSAEDFTAAGAMEASGLTRATVLGVCAELIEAGWLEEIEDSRIAGLSHRGRPARRYRLREDAGVVVGVDAGESRFDAAACDLRGRELASAHQEHDPATLGREGRLRVVRELVDEVLARSGQEAQTPLLTVVGIPAPVDAEGLSPDDNGAFWTVMNAGFPEHLPGMVLVENDANLAALAEHAHSPGENVATLLTGERFGAGLVIDGRLLRGHRGGAGEMRFLDLLAADDPDAGAVDGMGALARNWARAELARSEEPSLLRDGDPEQLQAQDVFRAAREGDALAERILRRMGARLAHVTVVLESLLDVDRVVVSGGIAAAIGPVIGHARTELEASFYPPFPQIEASRLGRDVIVRGAVELALSRIREDPLDFLPAGADASAGAETATGAETAAAEVSPR